MRLIKSTLKPVFIEKVLSEGHVSDRATADKASCSLYVNMRSSLKASQSQKNTSESTADLDSQFGLYQLARQSLKYVANNTAATSSAAESPFQASFLRSSLKAVPKSVSSTIVEDGENQGSSDLYLSTRQNLKSSRIIVPSLADLFKNDFKASSELYLSTRQNLKSAAFKSNENTENIVHKDSNVIYSLYLDACNNLKA